MSWKPKKTVVVPIDFSDASLNALRMALDCAERPDGVRIIHVVPSLSVLSAGSMTALLNDESHIEVALESLDKFVADHGIKGVTTAVMVGNAGAMIVDYANKCGADLIVIPSHGYHGYKRLLIGSTAERVLRHAHCPVLVLRRDKD